MNTPVSSRRVAAANIAGTLGYASCLLQWLWSGVIFVPFLLQSGAKDFLLPEPAPLSAEPATATVSSPLAIGLAVVVTVAVLAVVIVIALRLPKTVGKTGQKVTAKTADALLPVVVHHRKISPVKRRRLTVRLVKLIKFTSILLPLLALGFIGLVPVPLATEIIFVVGGILAAGSLAWFSLQYGLAKWLSVPVERLW